MEWLPDNVLTIRRSPARALCDLIEKHDRMPLNHSTRPELGRLIRLLAVEITRTKPVPLSLDGGSRQGAAT
jgi:hypothetical protein